MNLQEMKAKLAAIAALLEKFSGAETLTDEDVKAIDDNTAEFNALKKQIEAKEKLESVQAAAGTSSRRSEPAQAAAPRIEVGNNLDKNFGFKGMGDFLQAVKNKAGGNIDKRFQNTMFEKNSEDGGVLVPEEMMSVISKKFASDESLLAKSTQIKVSGNNMSLPTDETAPWTGGIQAYWVAEGGDHTASKAVLGSASWKLQKLGALVKVTDELLEDTTALESYIQQKAPEALMWKMNSAIISGDGVGKPAGILNSDFRKVVAAEGGQTADTVNYKNVVKMFSAMLPSSRGRAEWYINPAVEVQLRTMVDDNGNLIYLAPGSQFNQTPYGLLLGRPVIPLLGSMPALGDEGDIIFADLSYYYSLLKTSGIKQTVSAHLFFQSDIQAYKWVMRVDGKCPFKSPVTTEFGSYTMSAIVTLAAR